MEGHNRFFSVKWNFFFKFKMDGQDVILDIQWLKNISVRYRRKYPRIFLVVYIEEAPKGFKAPNRGRLPNDLEAEAEAKALERS